MSCMSAERGGGGSAYNTEFLMRHRKNIQSHVNRLIFIRNSKEEENTSMDTSGESNESLYKHIVIRVVISGNLIIIPSINRSPRYSRQIL